MVRIYLGGFGNWCESCAHSKGRKPSSSIDFVRMFPDKRLMLGGVPAGTQWSTVSGAGMQCAAYNHHRQGREQGYVKLSGKDNESLAISLPARTHKIVG